MIETIPNGAGDAIAVAAQLLHDCNVQYGEPAPRPDELAARVGDLIASDQVVVLLVRDRATGAAVGVAMMRLQASLWSRAREA